MSKPKQRSRTLDRPHRLGGEPASRTDDLVGTYSSVPGSNPGNGDALEPPRREDPKIEGKSGDRIFRSDFLREYRQRSRTGEVLKVSSQWVDPAYWVVLGLVLAGLAYAVLGQVREYASGPAIIRFGDRADLTAISDATVAEILVHPGEAVAPGRILVRFYSGQEAAEFEQADREFQLELVNLLRDPSDEAARRSMARLRSVRDRRLAQVEEKTMRAPIEGTVSDVRIRPGQHLESGDPVMTILGRSPKRMLIAVLPGNYRPLLRAGLPMRLHLTGYRSVHQELKVSAVGDEIVGPTAVRRYLGGDIGDAVPLSGPAVLVYADLPGRGFVSEGRERAYYDGMQGRVQVGVQTQSLLLALIPGLREVLERNHD